MQSGATSNFQQYGSSYTWNPATDDEVVNSPLLYFRPGVAIPIHSSRVRLVFDFTPVHKGKANVLYGDGHVAQH
jgi:prepilin-type processing-associated H-X9-DG protein